MVDYENLEVGDMFETVFKGISDKTIELVIEKNPIFLRTIIVSSNSRNSEYGIGKSYNYHRSGTIEEMSAFTRLRSEGWVFEKVG